MCAEFQGHASATTVSGSTFIGGGAEFGGAAGLVTVSGSTFIGGGAEFGGAANLVTVSRSSITATGTFTGSAALSSAVGGAFSNLAVTFFGGGVLRTGGVLAEEPFAASHPELVTTITPGRQVSERDRLEEYLKAPFETPTDSAGGYEQTDYGALVGTFAAFAEAVATARNNVLGSHYVDHAAGQALDEIGQGVLTPRREGEVDPDYRRRIKAAGRQLVSGGTIDEVIAIAALLLNVPESEIDFEEPFDRRTPARFDIRVDHGTLETAAISNEDFIGTVRDAKAGGVALVGTVPGGFTYRSESDFQNGVNDRSRGYNVGRYRGLIENYEGRSSTDVVIATLRSTIAAGESAATSDTVRTEAESPLSVGGRLSAAGRLSVRNTEQ